MLCKCNNNPKINNRNIYTMFPSGNFFANEHAQCLILFVWRWACSFRPNQAVFCLIFVLKYLRSTLKSWLVSISSQLSYVHPRQWDNMIMLIVEYFAAQMRQYEYAHYWIFFRPNETKWLCSFKNILETKWDEVIMLIIKYFADQMRQKDYAHFKVFYAHFKVFYSSAYWVCVSVDIVGANYVFFIIH